MTLFVFVIKLRLKSFIRVRQYIIKLKLKIIIKYNLLEIDKSTERPKSVTNLLNRDYSQK